MRDGLSARRAGAWRLVKQTSSAFQLALDSLTWAVAVPVAVWARLDFVSAAIPSVRWLRFTVLAVAIQTASGLLFGLYRKRWKYGSFEEASAAARSVVLTTVALYALNYWILVPRYVPFSVPLAAGFGALVAIGGYRYLYRVINDRHRRPSPGGESHRALVFGAGEGGTQLLTALLRDRRSTVVPVALLDDDARKRRLSIRGIRVVGTREHIGSASARFGADTLVIAIPSAGAVLIRDLVDRGREAGLVCKVLPSASEMLHGAGLGEIRDVTDADLLGRHQVTTDLDAVAGYLREKRVLVTGAGGSIGSELCRQVHAFAPASLVMLDRDESALHAVQLSIEGRALLDSPNVVLADMRDPGTMRRVFEEHRPQVVFHAGALKHLPLLERFPGEAVQSNVWGTLTVLQAAAAVGVERFVNISTDKAADPVSVLGYSKRIAERLTAYFGTVADTGVYLSVRFGNVLGSRGSVLNAFHAQIDAGGPVTVTHPDVTRYFMTVNEAVQLVVQAGAIGQRGEVLVLDMGDPVRIAEVARRLVAESGRPIDIVFTGLRPGEKLHEQLLATDEREDRPVHPLITHCPVSALEPEDVLKLEPWHTDTRLLVAELQRLAG